jgi:hypothetical protein
LWAVDFGAWTIALQKIWIWYCIITPRGAGNTGNGTRTPGSSRTLKIAKFGFSHVGGLYRAGYPVKVYALPFQNMGFLSEQ